MVGIVDQLELTSQFGKAIIADISTHKDPVERRALFGVLHFLFDAAYSKAIADVQIANAEREKSEKVAPRPKFSVIQGGA